MSEKDLSYLDYFSFFWQKLTFCCTLKFDANIIIEDRN